MLHDAGGCPISGTGRPGATLEIRDHRLGMPQLSPLGLSEAWLLRESGDAHWMALSRALGVAPAALRDSAGNRLYAAFLAITLSGQPLGAFVEDQHVETWHRLVDLAAPFAVSRTEVVAGGKVMLSVEMASVFVRREAEGCNKRIQRALPAALATAAEATVHTAAGKSAAGALRAIHRDLKHAAVPAPAARIDHRLCAEADLNGAGFVYFAAFADLLRRAECAARRGAASPAATMPFERQLAFYGNADAGESLALHATAASGGAQQARAISGAGGVLAVSNLFAASSNHRRTEGAGPREAMATPP
ncbi:MAG: Pnap_2097 family protein [Pseudomonadota bacterium]